MTKNRRFIVAATFCLFCIGSARLGFAQGSAPTTRPGPTSIFSGSVIQPEYPVPYRTPTSAEITQVMQRVHDYLDKSALPTKALIRETNTQITDFSQPHPGAFPDRGENSSFFIASYEMGVTYAGMVYAAQVTGDPRYADFVAKRYEMINSLRPDPATLPPLPPPGTPITPEMIRNYNPLRGTVAPRVLDDCGAMCAGMIKARRANIGPDMMPVINTYMNHIVNNQFRLSDGTLARKDPQPETLWLDDLYMSVPALAQMGKLSGDNKYFDDAAKQILQFSARMFNKQLGIYMHGWTTNSPEHPEFHWARANGWAVMAMVELLEVMPENHPQRNAVLEQLRAHLKGLASYQSGEGRWHQLLDRNDTYLETSASAMFVYCMARAINRGWVSAVAYGPAAQLGWNSVAAQVNEKGQVENTCVGTGLSFDPAYYYARPRSVFASHGYGPVLLAGTEMLQLLKNDTFHINSGIIQFVPATQPREQ
jgi:rhamnogalacturonyl hydrolase YesR